MICILVCYVFLFTLSLELVVFVGREMQEKDDHKRKICIYCNSEA